MQYSEDKFVAIARKYPMVRSELKARDTVFRLELDDKARRDISPWIMLGRNQLIQEEFDQWMALDNEEISEDEAIERMTDLMERYYNQRYPLR